MEIEKFDKDQYMVRVNKDEALILIKSLSEQLLAGNCNTGRSEFTFKNNGYFSIAVHEDLGDKNEG